MAQIRNPLDEVRIPFAKMSFTPDVPSSALGANEYNVGKNVETDVRGIRSMAGDEEILALPCPGTPTYISGGFRLDDRFWTIVATTEGKWYACRSYFWFDITPVTGPFTTYSQTTNITEAWNGTIPFFNDEENPPMFWPEDNALRLVTTSASASAGTATIGFAQQPAFQDVAIISTTGTFSYTSREQLKVGQKVTVSGTLTGTGTITGYSNPTTYYIVATNGVSTFQLSLTNGGAPITTTGGTTLGLTFIYAPFYVGEIIQVTGVVPVQFQGTFVATAATTTSVSYALVGTYGPQTVSGLVGPELPRMVMYSNQVPLGINNITYVSNTEYQIQLDQAQLAAPFAAGDMINITFVNRYFDGVYQVISATTSTINFYAPNGIGSVYPGNSVGTVAPKYSWNYNPNWSAVHAGWMRMYNTPNVGSILVAGNLTATNARTGQIESYPITVQWSQNFGLEDAPLTWTPTITNVANQLEVPLRGASLDAFPCNGQLFLCSYWDTVVFSPINYTTTSAPILGVRLFNQGRGLLTANCWANTDKMIYGIDARDIWSFDGTQFVGLGNQRVKNWFYDALDPAYTDRVFMEINSQRNQIEIYYTSKDADPADNGVPNKMISYRYDLDAWNSPRDVSQATMACESPVRSATSAFSWGYDAASRTVIYARGVTDSKIVQKDQGYSFITSEANPLGNIESQFRRDNIKLLPNYSGKLMVHRLLPEINNIANNELVVNPVTNPELVGTVDVKVEGAGSVGAAPAQTTALTLSTDTEYPWVQMNQNAHRVNSLELSNTSNSTMWICSASTWQYTQTEDDR